MFRVGVLRCKTPQNIYTMKTETVNWLNRHDYPFTSRYFMVNNQRLHYIDEGEGEVILFVHGTPSWSYDFRKLIKPLSQQYRCIAMDHIGFGLSDKPRNYDYTTQNHAKTLELFVHALQLKNITLIVHDFGGPIGLSMAVQNPTLIKKLVILNSWLWDSSDTPEFKKLKRILKSPLLPLLYRYLNFSPRFVLPASFVSHKPSPQVLKHYTSPFAKISQREGPLAFAHSLLHDQAWFEQLWTQKSSLVALPTLFIWGMRDSFITPSFLEKFISGFPHATVIKLADCGHFPQEEASTDTAYAIQQFMRN